MHTYAGAKRCADADSHLMESPGWLAPFADPSMRERLKGFSPDVAAAVEAGLARRPVAPVGELSPPELLKAKGWAAPGALDPAERSGVLDLLGFERQVVFPTFSPVQFLYSDDDDIVYGGVDALHRAMAAVCAGDERLVAVGIVPLRDPERAVAALDRALAEGCETILVQTTTEGGRAPSHVANDPFWARVEEAGVALMCHVGFGTGTLRRGWHDNGKPLPPDHIGGGENMRARDLPSVHHNAEKFLTCMVLDGVFARFPDLRCGVIELGASWVPGFLRALDAAGRNFTKFEPQLAELSMPPSDYVRRQVRFTPFPFDDVGWLIGQEGEEMFMFSSDFPHPEGGRDPIARFDASLDAHAVGEAARARFYSGNLDFLLDGKAGA